MTSKELGGHFLVAATDLTRYIKERLPLLFGIDVSVPRDHPPRTLPKAM